MDISKFQIDKRPLIKIRCYSPSEDIVYVDSLPPCADLNRDGYVDSNDLQSLISGWSHSQYDLDGDGVVTSSDVAMLLNDWGAGQCDDIYNNIPSVCLDSNRVKRGLSPELMSIGGFYNFIYDKLEKVYKAGFRRIVLECPSGLLTKNMLSLNVVDTFENDVYYNYKIKENGLISSDYCRRAVPKFDYSNAVDDSIFKGFATRIKTWLDSKLDNVDIYIEFEAKVPILNNIDFDPSCLSPNWNNPSFDLQKFDPNNVLHKEWFIYNSVPWVQYGIKGIVLNNLDITSFNSFKEYDNISEFAWKNSNQKIICNNIPLYNGSFYGVEEYSKCPYIIDFNHSNFTFDFGLNLRNNFNNYNEIHLLIPHSSIINDSFYSSIEDGAVSKGFVPGYSIKYGEDINLEKLIIQYESALNILEKYEKNKRKINEDRKFVIHSEYAGNCSDKFGVVSNDSSAYNRSAVSLSNKNIVPVIKVNCSKKITNLKLDISRTWCPSWWFTNNSALCIDETMRSYVVNSWTIENSDNILRTNTPSPYNTLGPEKCADAAYDLCLQYQAQYAGNIDFSNSKNVVIKLENWGDMYDHSPRDSETLDALIQGWCSLFTHYSDSVSSVNYKNESFVPINKFKNLFAKYGVVQCSKWMKRFLQRWNYRQQNRRSSIYSNQIANPGLIYLGKPEVLNVQDFVGSDNIGNSGTFINHLLDSRSSDVSVGFSWRNNSTLTDAYVSVDTGQYAEEFSVLRTSPNSEGTFGSIYLSNAILKSDPYLEQNNASIEKFLRILITEVYLRRIYECFGSVIENNFLHGRYGLNCYSMNVPDSSVYSKVQAPFYNYVNRWQHYPGLIQFNAGKSCSLEICHLNPSSIISKKYLDLNWPSIYDERMRYEVRDHGYYSSTQIFFDRVWGWPEKHGDDPSGRGIFINGINFDAAYAGPSHAAIVSAVMKDNHVNYISYIARAVKDFKLNSQFNIKDILLFSNGINNNASNVKLANNNELLGDFSTGTLSVDDGSSVTGYIFNKINYVEAFKSFINNNSVPDYIIHNHEKMSLQDWNDISSAIIEINSYNNTNQSNLVAASPDYDGNGRVDAADLSIFLNGWGTPNGDLDGDGIVTASDLAIILNAWGVLGNPPSSSSSIIIPPSSSSSSGGLIGDYDGNGRVDAADLATLLNGWGTPNGDLDGDGVVTASDLAILLNAWGVLGGQSSSSSSTASQPRVDAIKIRIDPSLNSIFQNVNGWRVRKFIAGNYLIATTVNSSGNDAGIIFNVQLDGKKNYDIINEISSVSGVYAESLNNSDYGDAGFLEVVSNGTININDGQCVLNNLESFNGFSGFSNPFTVISLEKTVNDISLIGINNAMQSYGGYAGNIPISAYGILESTISNSSTYFSVIDSAGILNTFKYVSIDGEIIQVKKWQSNIAEIENRGLFGTKRTFHASKSNIFGITEKTLFDENLFNDSLDGYLYQNRCIALKNIYRNVSVSNLSISLNSNVNIGQSEILVGVEVPRHRGRVLAGELGSSLQTITLSNPDTVINLRNDPSEGRSIFIGSCIKFEQSGQAPVYRSISSFINNIITLNQPLPRPVSDYGLIELYPAPSHPGSYGKSEPVISTFFSGFYKISSKNSFIIPVNMIDLAKNIEYNQIIYVWIKRKMPKDSRLKSISSLPLSFNFNIL